MIQRKLHQGELISFKSPGISFKGKIVHVFTNHYGVRITERGSTDWLIGQYVDAIFDEEIKFVEVFKEKFYDSEETIWMETKTITVRLRKRK